MSKDDYVKLSLSDPLSVIARRSRSNLKKVRGTPYNLMKKQHYIYTMTNKNNTVLYTGITNDIKRRVYEHKEKLIEGFTKKYSIPNWFIMRFSEMLRMLF